MAVAQPNGNRNRLEPGMDPTRHGGGGGGRPVECSSIKQILLMMLLLICRRIVFVNLNNKINIYLVVIVFGSLLRDFFPFPKTYLAQKNSFMYTYFAKLVWLWTFFLLGLFILLSSYTYCCGKISHIRPHLMRLAIAAVLWFVLTNLFVHIESVTGFCTNKGIGGKIRNRYLCLKSGHQWFGFDISSHTFTLVYFSLLIMEETKFMMSWDCICDLIRNEQWDDGSPLQCLSREDFLRLKYCYKLFTPYVRILFIVSAVLHLFCDFMLVITILYYHSLLQKLVGGLIAIATWYFTYCMWYKHAYPRLPGEGLFCFMHLTRANCCHR